MVTVSLPAALAQIEQHARSVADAWVSGGAGSCQLCGPAGERRVLAGSPAGDHGEEVPFAGALRGWSLGVTSPVPIDRARLEVDTALLGQLAHRTFELGETTLALIETNDQLLALYRLAASSASTLDDIELMQTLADDARELIGAAGASIEVDGIGRVTSGDAHIVEALLDEALLDETRVATSPSSDDRVARGGVGAGGRDYDVVRRRLRGDATGRLTIASRVGRRFSTAQLKLAEAVVDHVSGFLSLATMHQAALASAVIERDAKTAAELAQLVLPTTSPTIAGLDLAARCDPARLAAGDFYTWTETPDGLVFAVGDVAGKGLGAALVMTMVIGATTRAALGSSDPTAMFRSISAELYDYLSEASVFVTMVIGTYRPGEDTIRLANAGHSPVIARSGGRASMIAASAPPLGVFDDPGTTTIELPFSSGDALVIGTDGLAEQEDREGHQLGYERLVDLVRDAGTSTADSTIARLFDEVERFGAGIDPDDDRTALVLHRCGSPS